MADTRPFSLKEIEDQILHNQQWDHPNEILRQLANTIRENERLQSYLKAFYFDTLYKDSPGLHDMAVELLAPYDKEFEEVKQHKQSDSENMWPADQVARIMGLSEQDILDKRAKQSLCLACGQPATSQAFCPQTGTGKHVSSKTSETKPDCPICGGRPCMHSNSSERSANGKHMTESDNPKP